MSKEHKILPLIPLRGIVVFPYMLLHFDVVRKKSILALEQAMANDQLVFLCSQKDANIESPSASELNNVGTVAKIKQMLKMPGDTVRVLVEGIERGKISEIIHEIPNFTVCVEYFHDFEPSFSQEECEALRRKTVEVFKKFSDSVGKIPRETITSVSLINDISQLSDVIAANVLVKFEQKQDILNQPDPYERLLALLSILSKEMEIIKIQKKISSVVKGQMDKNQREYFLREQLKAIENELELSEGIGGEISEYKAAFSKIKLPEYAKAKVEKELSRLKKMQSGSAEAGVVRGYLDLLLELPWSVYTKESVSISKSEKILDQDHFGLEKVKERILEFLAVRILSNDIKSPILCLVGPPGVGKTSIASSIARCLNRKFARMSLGGVRDEAEIRGHRKTYVGAMPGRIINAIKNAGSMNPVLLLDEIDKMGNDFRGDPAAALLEVLDKEQNVNFRDHYVEIPFDLSNVLFITTANSLDTISRPLLDRMEIIEISGYTDSEKHQIATGYLIPGQRKAHGLSGRQLKFEKKAILDIINYYTKESGVRNLERTIGQVCRKAAKKIATGDETSVTISSSNLTEYLGPYKYLYDMMEECPQVGLATGLAWTSVGGVTLPVEVNVMDGTGKVELTGQLGDVMKESAKAAISYVRANCDKLSIDCDFYKTKDIHIHVPEGATPKDGPSAGITITTAIVSALSGKPVLNTVAMTGEVTLRGKVLPIGGLKEKSLAAYRAGIKTVIIPSDNYRDINEIPEAVRSEMSFITVSDMDKVLKFALAEEKNEYFYRNGNIDDVVELRQ